MKRHWIMLFEVLFLAVLCVCLGLMLVDRSPHFPGAVDIKIQLRGARDKTYLFHDTPTSFKYRITKSNGSTHDLNPHQFAAQLYDDQASRHWASNLLNVSSPFGFLWVGVGFLGQVLFTGRMVVQWLASEKHQKSVVPPLFWWMSLIGSTMLLIYFAWRQDPVGLIGQAFGWFIYLRNIWLIYTHHTPTATICEDPAPEPELDV